MEFADGINFYADGKEPIQVASFKLNCGYILKPHRHIDRKRIVSKTQEVLVVLGGSVLITIFDDDNAPVEIKVLVAGDFAIIYNGGVSYKVLSDNAKLLEAKVGPYDITDDSEDRELICM